MSQTSLSSASIPPVQVQPPADYPWHLDAHETSHAPEGSSIDHLPHLTASTSKFKSYWRIIGGGSLSISIAIHVGLLIVATFVINTIAVEDEVDFLPGGSSKQGQEATQTLSQQVQIKRHSTFAKPPSLQRIVSSSTATISVPDLPLENFDLPAASLLQSKAAIPSGGFASQGLGSFSEGFGSGLGKMKGLSFFGLTTELDRVLFILDYSRSMRPNQVDLVVQEMDKTLSKLPLKSQYQVILFAGGARFAGKYWSIDQQRGDGRDTFAVHRNGKRYRFFSPENKASDWSYDGTDDELPAAQWLNANTTHTRDTMNDLEERNLWYGTDWRWPFKMALNMKPAPKVIYFMTDGTGGADVDLILEYKDKKKASVTIHTLLMHTSAGAPAMQRLARETKGNFSIVRNDGSSITGDEYFADRKKYDQQLKER